MVIVSACLAGVNCKYNGKNNLDERVVKLVAEGKAIPLCPEQLGGCTTPRVPAEIFEGAGRDVLDGKCRVLTTDGEDITDKYLKGAYETLRIARISGAKKAILKSMSPSCGCGRIYDGTFSGKTHEGNGVTAELLQGNGIKVITENDLYFVKSF